MKRTYLLLMCVLSFLVMTAAQFSQDQAKHAAEQFLREKTVKVESGKWKVERLSSLDSRLTTLNDGPMTTYAVNLGSNEGFVLVAGTQRNSRDY